MKYNIIDVRNDILLLQTMFLKVRSHAIDFSDITLVSALENLLNKLKTVDENWMNLFISCLLEIEVVCSLALERDLNYFTDENRFKLKKSFDLLLEIVGKKLKELICYVSEEYVLSPDLSIQDRAEILDDKWLMCPICIDAWECKSIDAMVFCPKCNRPLHNPRK